MCSKSKIREFDRNRLFVIAVDGLDVSGKETFSTNLKNVLDFQLKQLNLLNVNIDLVSFPRYSTDLGIKIKEYLQRPIEERDHKQVELFFKEDRKQFFKDYLENTYQEDCMNILICDRYAYSMLIYAQLRLYKELDVPTYTVLDNEINANFESEFEDLPIPDLTLIFNRVDDKSILIHKELLKNKQNKDKNEVEEVMEILSNKINTKVLPLIKKYSQKLYIIPIGSNFGNDLIETGIATTIIGKMVDNKLCTIKYPSEVIYYENETERKIGKLPFNPDIEIEYAVNPKDDVIENLSKRVLSTIKTYNLIKSNPMSKDFSEFLSNMDKLPSWDLIVRILNEYEEKDINEDNINKIVKTLLFSPIKESRLNCHYRILSPYDIKLNPSEIKEISLGISLKRISVINKKYENCVIDLDIKTSKKCIMQNGVSVADSPSSISGDYEGELKIVLINHTNEHKIIKAGEELAILVVKSSSCETVFKLNFE